MFFQMYKRFERGRTFKTNFFRKYFNSQYIHITTEHFMLTNSSIPQLLFPRNILILNKTTLIISTEHFKQQSQHPTCTGQFTKH